MSMRVSKTVKELLDKFIEQIAKLGMPLLSMQIFVGKISLFNVRDHFLVETDFYLKVFGLFTECGSCHYNIVR